MNQVPKSPGLICTFYSFKGGVGRSMALANVAALLAKWGQRVLVVDWDLEAPGIEKYFENWIAGSRRNTPGLVDLCASFSAGPAIDWQECLLNATLPQSQKISILHAGREDDGYVERLRALDWGVLFRDYAFGLVLENLRAQWREKYDFILIDSRTGITDIGGICTILLPDVLFALFTANGQSLAGVRDVIRRVRSAHASLEVDRKRLLIAPIPARDESGTEYKLAAEWRRRFANELRDIFVDWIPRDEDVERVLDHLKVPYFAFWSFGERLPAVEEDADNPKTLAFAYQILARLLLGRMSWDEVKRGAKASVAETTQIYAAKARVLEAEQHREQLHRQAAERDRRLQEEEAVARYDRFIKIRFEPAVLKLRRRRRWCTGGIVLGSLLGAFGLLLTWIAAVDYRNSFGSIGEAVLAAAFAAVAYGCGAISWAYRRNVERILARLMNEHEQLQIPAGPYEHLDRVAAAARFIEEVNAITGNAEGRSPKVAEDTKTPAPHEAVSIQVASETPTRLQSTASTLGSVPQTLTVDDTDYACDVLLSYRPTAVTSAWLREFVPLLTSWTEETLGRPIRLVDSSVTPLPHEDPARIARVLIPIITPAFARSVSIEDFRGFIGAEIRVLPVLLHRGEDIPRGWSEFQLADFSDFAFVGEGFSKTERYVDFQLAVRRFAAEVAVAIGRVPAFVVDGPGGAGSRAAAAT